MIIRIKTIRINDEINKIMIKLSFKIYFKFFQILI